MDLKLMKNIKKAQEIRNFEKNRKQELIKA